MADSPRRWYRVRLRTLVVWILLLTIGYTAYTYWSDYVERTARREREMLSPSRGDVCTVVLRREVLGLTQTSPSATTVEGVANYVEGRFVLMNDQWIVLGGLKEGQPQHWIPRENVLLVEVQEQ